MICAKLFSECKKLTSHLLGHDASDLKVLGFERFKFARMCKVKQAI